ncbi:DUF58 domain-containing protein [Natronorubrum tibetense]|uniref:DUF58 domain-containing protein n=1 Tax=Natronorubrum tibetense GA33 TaxID=1114856 RepID=L9W7Y0_9EURY|nr:DUF58 domain-containing protein [Natronorubrum tibetense]ELY45574.1 hypothetical protein C496_04098 [Natronorubrum tibetense GA33]
MNTARIAVLFGSVAFLAAIGTVVGVFDLALTSETIVFVGLVALGIGLVGLSRARGDHHHAGTPDPERRTEVPVPGRSLADAAEEFRGMKSSVVVDSNRLTAKLKTAAIASLTRFEGLSGEESIRRVEDGTWTDDRTAAAFLSESREFPPRSIRERLTGLVSRSGETRYQTGVRHAVAAIVAVSTHPFADEGEDSSVESESPTAEFGRPIADRDRPSLSTYGRSSVSHARSRSNRRTTTDSVEDVTARRPRPTGHWSGVGAVALLAVGIGAIAESPAVVLAGVVGVGYAGFAYATEPPVLDISLERAVSDDDPEPGDDLEVTLTITNESGSFVPDLRLVDGVPPGMAVTEGTSRLGTALRPGESVTLEYAVTARRGSHAFDPALVLTRDLSRSTEREQFVGAETTIVCEPSMRPLASAVPLRDATAAYAGRIRTAEGGSGTTIHSVREYRKSDPLNRIDWNRRAKTGDLATLEFHEERAARVIVLIDARLVAYHAPLPDAAHAVDRSVDAAGRIGTSLLSTGESVGLAAIGPVSRDATERSTSDPCWLAPGSGRHHEVEFRESLATHPQFATHPPDGNCHWRRQLRTIRRRLSGDSQVVFLTPLCDNASVEIARQLEAHGHPVTVVSPDPTADRTAGQQLSRVARRVRVVDLQRAGIPVVDWPDDESLDTVFARHAGGRR